jgi:hypothetical protein
MCYYFEVEAYLLIDASVALNWCLYGIDTDTEMLQLGIFINITRCDLQ